MKNDIQLPDYLPSRYANWLELYLDVKKQFEEAGIEITEDTKVNLFDNYLSREDWTSLNLKEEYVAFYQEWPVTVLKARAFDYLISKLPKDLNIFSEIRERVYSYGFVDNKLEMAMFELFRIVRSMRKFRKT